MKMYTQKPFSTPQSKQKGAALVMSLIILVVITLIGVSSMSTSLLQEKMASNAQSTNVTFQAAESAIGSLVTDVLGGDQSALNQAMGADDNTGSIIGFNINDPDVAASYQVRYMGVVALTSGGSLDADESSTTLQAHRFDIASTGAVTATNAQTVIRQGIEYR